MRRRTLRPYYFFLELKKRLKNFKTVLVITNPSIAATTGSDIQFFTAVYKDSMLILYHNAR